MLAAIWSRRPGTVLAVTALVACLSALMDGPVSDAALATSATDRGAQRTWEDGRVVSVEVPADLRADERAGVNAQTETGKASVANPVATANGVVAVFQDPGGVAISMAYSTGLTRLSFSGLSQVGWPEGFTGHVSIRQDSRSLGDGVIQSDTLILYPPSGYAASRQRRRSSP